MPKKWILFYFFTAFLGGIFGSCVYSTYLFPLRTSSFKDLSPPNSAPPGSAPAQFMDRSHKACEKDSLQFCNDSSSADSVDACLQDHYEEVSGPCKRSLKSVRESLSVCQEDIRSFCPQAHYGGGRMVLCLRAKFEKLSTQCQKRVLR